MQPQDDVSTLAGEPGWAVAGPVATYRPVEHGWSATVRLTTVFGKAYTRWHIAVVDPRGHAQQTLFRSRLVDARLAAERQVRGRAAI